MIYALVMPRISLDLNKASDRQKLKAQWRRAVGLVPGEPNQGLVALLEASPAPLADYDDSGWEVCDNIRESLLQGLTFAWYRITIELPEAVDGVAVAGGRVYVEANADNHAEIWVDGQLDRTLTGVMGFNAQQRVPVGSGGAVPGAKHVIACLVANGPFAEPRGGIYLRYVTLAIESAN
jgi:hypothetical protein